MLCTALCYQGIMVICPVSGVNAGENGLRKSVCATFTWTLCLSSSGLLVFISPIACSTCSTIAVACVAGDRIGLNIYDVDFWHLFNATLNSSLYSVGLPGGLPEVHFWFLFMIFSWFWVGVFWMHERQWVAGLAWPRIILKEFPKIFLLAKHWWPHHRGQGTQEYGNHSKIWEPLLQAMWKSDRKVGDISPYSSSMVYND